MAFPPIYKEAVYEKAPLVNVICQARFPSILKIETGVPAAFQDRLGNEYPDLTESQEVAFGIQISGKPRLPEEEIGQTQPKNYGFASEDKTWKVNLTRNFVSLSTTNYTTWEEFKTRFNRVLDAFEGEYRPLAYTRIGLRYVNVIVRSRFELNGADWSELINQALVGVVGSPELEGGVRQFQSTFTVDLGSDESMVRVNIATVKQPPSDETCFMIDNDFFELKKRKPAEVVNRLDVFNSKAYSLFRWCITDKLHEAMRPK